MMDVLWKKNDLFICVEFRIPIIYKTNKKTKLVMKKWETHFC